MKSVRTELLVTRECSLKRILGIIFILHSYYVLFRVQWSIVTLQCQQIFKNFKNYLGPIYIYIYICTHTLIYIYCLPTLSLFQWTFKVQLLKLSLRFVVQNFIWWVLSPVRKSEGEMAEALEEQNKIFIMKLKPTLRRKNTLSGGFFNCLFSLIFF